MRKKRIIILGGGLAGLSAAWHLQKKGMECSVFEKEPQVGGLCRSKQSGGFTFDYDGHLLHFRHPYTLTLVKKVLDGNLQMHERNASIYSFDRFIRYPFQANLHGLPLAAMQECLLEYIKAQRNNHHLQGNNNFSQWIHATFGKGIARNFMVPYNTKFWTLPPGELTCEWFEGFIPVPSLEQVIEGTVQESHAQLGYNIHFWYPKKGGIHQLALALVNQLHHVYTNQAVTELNLKKKEITIASGSREKFDFLISTVPLPELPLLIKDIPKEVRVLFKRLRWNSIFNLNLGINERDISGYHWVYFPDKDIPFFRVGFPHSFYPDSVPRGKSSAYVEVAYSQEKPLHRQTIIADIKKGLKKIGFLKREDQVCCQDINDITYGYPIYDKQYHDTRKKILRFLWERNVFACGRYGSWRYMSMEDVLLDGREVALRLLHNDGFA